ncbi:unnamed protein product, partial [Anisakis simplex]|uniref:Uncharacterized protein n=1 Tax=Anisakis simplex TaxID=6269 RepID=A0A0M3JCK0_ANISI
MYSSFVMNSKNIQMPMDAYNNTQFMSTSPPQMINTTLSQFGINTAATPNTSLSAYNLQHLASSNNLNNNPQSNGISPFVLHSNQQQLQQLALSPPIVTSQLVMPSGASYVNNVPDINTNTFRLHQNNMPMDAYNNTQFMSTSPPQMINTTLSQFGINTAATPNTSLSAYNLQHLASSNNLNNNPQSNGISPFVLHSNQQQLQQLALSPPIVTSQLVMPSGASYVNNVPDINTNTFRLHQN